ERSSIGERHDTAKNHQVVHAERKETSTVAIKRKAVNQSRHARNKRGMIIFTDPDYPGERIRHSIDQSVPGCKHAFLTKEKARAKHPHNKSLGIEHASPEAIKQALADVYELMEIEDNDINKTDLIAYGLIGGPGASNRRERLGELLQIGHTNGKQLLKRLTMFQITKAQLEQAIAQMQQEGNDD